MYIAYLRPCCLQQIPGYYINYTCNDYASGLPMVSNLTIEVLTTLEWSSYLTEIIRGILQ